ncbi:MAG TPA: SAM-dependent methyltransferase [Chthoniobacterales bacterium]|nr:SAM-dependent methyltransferase [Chthoniobacterales bacterium]
MSGHSELIAAIRETIGARGPITFAAFMELALYHPEHGYYRSRCARIGRRGDYFTNVSVGPLFGRFMAAQFAEMFERLGRPADFTIVEEGAHRGDFARDVLESGAPLPTRYIAVERAVSSERDERITWRRSLDEVEPFCGVHFSNELIDSFPVHLVRWTGSEWLERHVALEKQAFDFVDMPLSNQELAAAVDKIPLPLPVGYETEVNLAALRWIERVAEKLRRGYVIAVDFGFLREEFYAPHRTTGTLQARLQHKRLPDPLSHVGEADVTAHVEWTSVMEHAQANGLELLGFTDQHHFLTGLLTEAIAADRASARALQTLLHPSMMGMQFQFLVLGKGVPTAPPLSGLRFARSASRLW